MTGVQRDEVKACIEFYEARGKDWGDVVGFLCMKYEGRLERYLNPYRTKMPHEYVTNDGRGRPRGSRQAEKPGEKPAA